MNFYSFLMLSMSMFPLLLSFYLFFFSTFISLEISLSSFSALSIPMSLMIDWTSMLFLFTVMFISSMILMYSMGYIPPLEQKQFSILLMLFVMSMSLLILSDNIIFILLGWDGLGLTSFVLVIFYQNASSSASGSITIFSNRIGDILIIISIALMTSTCVWNFSMNENFPKILMIFLLLAACSKSAQFPFSAWLPAAMAAPTPISALVHSSTLVTAGVYLLIRIMNYPHPFSMLLIMLISTMTAIYASLSANWEMDMKKIIALSTLSQIAMMMFALSLGSTNMAFFHLIIHALFKSTMFLCAGIIIHTSSYQDMRSMTLLNKSPLYSSILGISSLSLMGIPFMSGFFSKDPIVETVILSNSFSFITILMILSIGMTSMYSIRMLIFSMKFFIKSKPDMNIHPTNFMEIPIMIMSPMSIMMGTILMWNSFPEQIIIIPNMYKFIILSTLLLGFLSGNLLSFYNINYNKMGQSSISLWFNHFISTMIAPFMFPLMNNFLKNDKTWQEVYGPKYMYMLSSKMSSKPDFFSTQLLFIIMMITLFPILMLSL